MNKPISYPLAKLLKEKGFDEPCPNLYYQPERCKKPTIADVVMWLYEKHGIWLYCEIKGDNFYVKAKKIKSNWRRVVSGVVDNENILFNSPIEAYEAGIKYCLEKVI